MGQVRLFGVDIAAVIKASMASGLLPVRLRKRQRSALDPDDPTAEPSVSYRAYPCRGVEDEPEQTRLRGTQVDQASRFVLILADTLPRGVEPEPGDRIEILGLDLEIVGDGVSTDPARATYLCACRG